MWYVVSEAQVLYRVWRGFVGQGPCPTVVVELLRYCTAVLGHKAALPCALPAMRPYASFALPYCPPARSVKNLKLLQDHSEVVQGLVLHLRSNGFIAYVPAFDAKGPVYLNDVNGQVQVLVLIIGTRKTDLRSFVMCITAVLL